MDAKFQPSFIPKQSIMSAPRSPANISILYVVASIVFILILGLIAVVFLVEKTIKEDIDTLTVELVEARNALELPTIAFLKEVSGRAQIANGILNRHVATSRFFKVLEDETFVNVAFSSFSAETNEAQEMEITLEGTAASYNTLILQKNLFSEIPFLTKAQFSGFELNDSGSVGFSFSGSVDPRLIDYKLSITEE